MESETLQHTAAAAISAALEKRGIMKQQDQATIVGESPASWNRHTRGHRGPSLAKVFAWMEAAAENGHKLKLRLNLEDGVVVARR